MVVVDRARNEVEWHIEGIHYMTSRFTQQMKAAAKIYMFIQLWNADDKVIMLNS